MTDARNPVLVTGGAGFIGAHTAKALAMAGFTPVVVDDLRAGRRDFVRWGPFYQVDVGNAEALAEVVSRERPLAAVHFAASIEVGLSVRDPAAFYANNVVNALSMLDVLRSSDVKTLVFSSTAAVYGMPETIPIDEEHPKAPINPYGATKLAVEQALRWFGEAYGIRWAALRYFNAAGAHPDGDLGEAHEPETHLIPLVIEAALGRRPAVRIFGTDYDTPDGTAVRDYVHVADLAAAHVAALRWLLDGGDSMVANLGTGTGFSVREVIDAVGRAAGADVRYKEAPRRAGDPPRLIADPSRAMKAFNWTPARSDLLSIVETAMNWHARAV